MAVLDIAITPGSIRAVDDLLEGFHTRLPRALSTTAATEAEIVAERLKANVTAEFKAGVDKYGRSHDKTHKTVGSFHVEPSALGAFVILGGAADLVDRGFRAHPIDAKNGGWLMFTSPTRGFTKTKHVDSPGFKGDPFVQKGIDKTDLGAFTARAVGAAYASLFLHSQGHI